jgi:hypothetical protein
MTVETENEKALRRVARDTMKAEKRKQVLAFAKDLGCGKKQAKVFRKVASGYFKLAENGLAFRGMGDKLVSVDSDQSINFFRKKYPFLMKETAAATADPGAADPADIALAKSGNMTAKGRVLVALNGNEAALAAALADNGKRNDTVANGQDKSDTAHKNNPWKDLRGRDGKISAEKQQRCEAFIKFAGTKAAISCARSAGVRLDGSPLDPKYL